MWAIFFFEILFNDGNYWNFHHLPLKKNLRTIFVQKKIMQVSVLIRTQKSGFIKILVFFLVVILLGFIYRWVSIYCRFGCSTIRSVFCMNICLANFKSRNFIEKHCPIHKKTFITELWSKWTSHKGGLWVLIENKSAHNFFSSSLTVCWKTEAYKNFLDNFHLLF